MAEAKSYEDFIEGVLRKSHEKNQQYARDIRNLLASDSGESLLKIIEALASGYKDAAVFADDDKERLTHRGAILSLGALVAYLNDLAANYVEPDPRGQINNDLPFQDSGFTVGAEFEESV